MIVVDDMVQVGNSKRLLDEFLEFLLSLFTITDDGPVCWCLGVAYDHNEVTGNMTATLTAYIDRAIQRFKLEHSTTVSEPMAEKFKVVESDLDPHPLLETLHLSMWQTCSQSHWANKCLSSTETRWVSAL